MSLARSIGALVGRRALARTILGMTIYLILCRVVLTVFFLKKQDYALKAHPRHG